MHFHLLSNALRRNLQNIIRKAEHLAYWFSVDSLLHNDSGIVNLFSYLYK